MRHVLLLALAACGPSSGDAKPDAAMMNMPDAAVSTATALTATMRATRTLDRAFYGVNMDGTLHVEAQKGGDPGCPQMASPAPDYTLVIGKVPAMDSATATSTATFLDYVGDMLPSTVLLQAADTVSLTSVVYQEGTAVALDAMLMFPAGAINGHLYAMHCTSLDD